MCGAQEEGSLLWSSLWAGVERSSLSFIVGVLAGQYSVLALQWYSAQQLTVLLRGKFRRKHLFRNKWVHLCFFAVILEIFLYIIESWGPFNVDDTAVPNFEILLHQVSVITTILIYFFSKNFFWYQSQLVVVEFGFRVMGWTRNWLYNDDCSAMQILLHTREQVPKILPHIVIFPRGNIIIGPGKNGLLRWC